MTPDKIEISISIKSIGFLLVGAAAPTSTPADLSFNKVISSRGRDGNIEEEYVINGSSFKGWLRSALYRVANRFEIERCDEGSECGRCTLCKLFGTNGRRGMLYVSNLYPTRRPETTIITHVSLSDRTLTAVEHALYSAEYVKLGTEFHGSIEIEDAHSPDLLYALRIVLIGLAALRTDRVGRRGIIDLKITNAKELRDEVSEDVEAQLLLSSLQDWGWDA